MNEKALLIDLHQKRLKAFAHTSSEVSFRGQNLGEFNTDILLDDVVMIEQKALIALLPEHNAKLIKILKKATSIEVGLLVFFGNPNLEYRRYHK